VSRSRGDLSTKAPPKPTAINTTALTALSSLAYGGDGLALRHQYQRDRLKRSCNTRVLTCRWRNVRTAVSICGSMTVCLVHAVMRTREELDRTVHFSKGLVILYTETSKCACQLLEAMICRLRSRLPKVHYKIRTCRHLNSKFEHARWTCCHNTSTHGGLHSAISHQ
jgi:hypothetical protein